MTDVSSASKVRPAMLQLVDHRGNVVVVDGGTRLTGQIRSLPDFFSEGSEVEIVLIVGFEPVQLRVVVVEGCDCRPGAIAVISMVEWIAGGRRFRPDDGKRRDRRIDDAIAADAADAQASRADTSGAGLKGRLEDMSLVDVVQMLASGRRSGVVDVRAADALTRSLSGRLGLDGGRITFADVRVDPRVESLVNGNGNGNGGGDADGDVTGEDALFVLLAAARGRFAVRFDAAVPAENISRDTTFLLLEFLRQLDEGGQAAIPNEGRTGSWQGLVPQLESQLESRAESAVIRPAMAVPQPLALSPIAPLALAKPIAETRLMSAAPTFAPEFRGTPPAPGFEIVRASTMPPPLPPSSRTSSKTIAKKRRASLPPQPERELVARNTTGGATVGRATGRFAGFFEELQQSEPSDGLVDGPLVDGPPPSLDDADDFHLPVTDAVRFSSLDATVTGAMSGTLSTNGPFGPGDRDTDIVDRALISASSG